MLFGGFFRTLLVSLAPLSEISADFKCLFFLVRFLGNSGVIQWCFEAIAVTVSMWRGSDNSPIYKKRVLQ